MSKRRRQDSDFTFGSEDDPIGLTSAFAPVKGPQSVEYDKGDDAIGLTQAFEPIPEQEEPRAWDEAGKWRDFDWNAPVPGSEQDEDDSELASAPDVEPVSGEAATATVSPSATGSIPPTGKPSSGGSGRGRHAAPDASMSPRMQKSRRTRRLLIALLVLLILAAVALGVFMFRTFSQSQQEAAQTAQTQVETPKEDIGNAPSDDAGDATVRLTEVPEIVSLLGMNSDAAIAQLGHGALVTANRAVDEEGNPVKTNLNVALTDEPNDSKTGTPTVYLGLNQDGNVVQVGYSASASALGFGSLSFSDAVTNEHVVEKTLARIGVDDVAEGSVELPADKGAYSSYGPDGSTVVRERCSFEGQADINGTPCAWSSVLSYDYTTQVVTGNLSDTVRIIYVYVTQQ